MTKRFLVYNFFSTLLSSVQYTLSSHSLLSSVHLSSTGLILTGSFLSKDVVGQLFSLYFIHRNGRQIDVSPRRQFKKSAIIEQLSTLAECATPLLPFSAFVPLTVTANTYKNVSFAMFGAFNVKAIQALSSPKTTGELYSNLVILNSLSSAIGMGLGLVIVAAIPRHDYRLLIVPVIGVLKVYCHYKSLKECRIF